MKRLFFAIPIPYDSPDSFWKRDLGVLVVAFREMGLEAFLVALHPNVDKMPDKLRPVITCSLKQMSDPAWWAGQNPEAVVCNLWSAPRYDAIRKAALRTTPRVIERLDTSGVRVPRIWLSYYFTQCWTLYRDGGWQPWTSLIPAVFRTLLFYFVPSVLERPMALTMAQLPYVVAESPLAAARTERHIRWHSQKPVQVAQIPIPVYTRNMYFSPSDVKTNALVSVGRWNAHQKDFPLLLAAAVDFLQRYPDWTFEIIGSGVDQNRVDRTPAGIRERIHIHGQVRHEEIASINRRAKIHFMASRAEGFANASVEALCCGCSYVGPINIAASSYLIEFQSGTIAPRRRRDDLADALVAEAEAWKHGRRNPLAIAEKWKAETGYMEVARRTLALLESIPLRAQA